jgi:hypothetical protein
VSTGNIGEYSTDDTAGDNRLGSPWSTLLQQFLEGNPSFNGLYRIRLFLGADGPPPAAPSYETYYLVQSQIVGFVTASLQLHYNPGVNPYSEEDAAPLEAIAVASFTDDGPYWWTTPGLGTDPGVTGAMMLSPINEAAIWKRPLPAPSEPAPVHG